MLGPSAGWRPRVSFGTSTASMTWITPLLAGTSVVIPRNLAVASSEAARRKDTLMTDSAAARLAAKLSSLDLTDGEAALLGTVFRLAHEAGGPEVAGFSAAAPLSKDLFVSTSKPFKGSDEELQAIVDWLGSLEAQK